MSVESLLLSCSLVALLLAFYILQLPVKHELNIRFNQSTYFAGLVLARGGSKGIPLKNLAKVGNQTLLARALREMKQLKRFNSIWVSTDSQLIAQEAESHNASVFWRSELTASDTAASVVAVLEFVEHHPEVEAVGLVQCTSPFLKVEYLEKAYRMLLSGKVQSVFSVTKQHRFRWKTGIDGNFQPDNFDLKARPRRQDWSGELIENGMFYFTFSRLVKEHGHLQGGKLGYVEVPVSDSLEIDTETDLLIAEALVDNR